MFSNQLRLSVLGYGWNFGLYDPAQTLRNMIPFAQEIERMGYSRIWITEHHGPGIAWGCPEALVTAIAQATTQIRVGTGGIQLAAYNPLKVANDFKCLAALFPDRIDLGIGSGFNGVNHHGLAGHVPSTRDELRTIFWKKTKVLMDLLSGKEIKSGPFKGSRAYPEGEEVPTLWFLGLGGKPLVQAEKWGKNYCHGLMLKAGSETAKEIAQFRKSALKCQEERQMSLSISVVCAESEAKAKKLFNKAMPTFNTQNPHMPDVVIGTPEMCVDRILALQQDYCPHEIVMRSMIADPNERLESFGLLAKACQLAPQDLKKRVS